MPVHDELDTRIREVIVKLVDASPPSPPFPASNSELKEASQDAARPRHVTFHLAGPVVLSS